MGGLAFLLALAGFCVHESAGVQNVVNSIHHPPGECPTSQDRVTVRDQITAQVLQILSASPQGCSGRGWRRVAFLNATDPSQDCPPGLTVAPHPLRTCGSSHTSFAECSFSVTVGPTARCVGGWWPISTAHCLQPACGV